MDLNKVTLIGNITKDPISKNLPSGQAITTMTVATNYVWKDPRSKEKKNRAEFHRVVAWGHLAEIISAYLKKGSKIFVEGRLQNRMWEDKNKIKKYMTEIVASDLIMLGGSQKKEAKGDENAKEEEEVDIEEIQIEEDN